MRVWAWSVLLAVCAGLSCNGNVDMYLLFDLSGSAAGNFDLYMRPFADSVISNFMGPNVALSLIWFADEGHLEQGLTKDQSVVSRALDRISGIRHTPEYRGTNIGGGLSMVGLRAANNKLVFIISDGCDSDRFRDNSFQTAQGLKDLGVEIFIIYIPSGREQCPRYLQLLASAPAESHYFPILVESFFDQLNSPDFINNLLALSCVEVERVRPMYLCNSSSTQVTVSGKGFASLASHSDLQCKFQVYPCVDDGSWRDGGGNGCASYRKNPKFCFEDAFTEAQERCPVACGLCTDSNDFCRDDPNYPLCPKWAQEGRCEAVGSRCRKSCGSCGVVAAKVESDTVVKCTAPALGSLAKFQVLITRNGKVWAQGSANVSTFPCSVDPASSTSIIHTLALEAVGTPRFSASDDSIVVSFTLRNDGNIPIAGPFKLNAAGFASPGITCAPVSVLEPGQSMICSGRKQLLPEDITNGRITTSVSAGGFVDSVPVQSAPMQFVMYSQTPVRPPPSTPPPTPRAKPTPRPTPRTRPPTRRPTAKRTPKPTPKYAPNTETPTESPTPSPSAYPTDSPTFSPTPSPSRHPTVSPTSYPTLFPSPNPTGVPTASPTFLPSFSPTSSPTSGPSLSPTHSPTVRPTPAPSSPTSLATLAPSGSNVSALGVVPRAGTVEDSICDSAGSIRCQPWVWAVVGIGAAVLLAGVISMIVRAMRTPKPLTGPPVIVSPLTAAPAPAPAFTAPLAPSAVPPPTTLSSGVPRGTATENMTHYHYRDV